MRSKLMLLLDSMAVFVPLAVVITVLIIATSSHA
jgi:hypothetical protein